MIDIPHNDEDDIEILEGDDGSLNDVPPSSHDLVIADLSAF